MMDTLTSEQIAELKTISSLPKEKQQPILEKFLSRLSPEQMRALQQLQQQGEQCVFCLINEGKIESAKVYDDQFLMAVLDIRPLTRGQTLIFSKKHVPVLSQLPPEEQAHILLFASMCSGALFSALKCTGTNVVINQGAGAGQVVPHASITILPRYDHDGVELDITGKEASKETLHQLVGILSQSITSAVQQLQPAAHKEVIEEKTEEPAEQEPLFDERLP